MNANKLDKSGLVEDSKLLGEMMVIAIAILVFAFYEIVLKTTGRIIMIILMECLFPVFAIHRGCRKWRTDKALAKESLLDGLLGGMCIVGIVAFWPSHRPLIWNSLMATASVAGFIICLLWNDHIREKI